jgi:hypothetical protein
MIWGIIGFEIILWIPICAVDFSYNCFLMASQFSLGNCLLANFINLTGAGRCGNSFALWDQLDV